MILAFKISYNKLILKTKWMKGEILIVVKIVEIMGNIKMIRKWASNQESIDHLWCNKK